MIDRLAKYPEECLNLKNEWGHSKNPSLEAKAQRPKVQPPESKGKRGKEAKEEHHNPDSSSLPSPQLHRGPTESQGFCGSRESEL